MPEIVCKAGGFGNLGIETTVRGDLVWALAVELLGDPVHDLSNLWRVSKAVVKYIAVVGGGRLPA